MDRPTKILYYLEMAKTAASRSTCIKQRHGAILVKDDEIISTGYNGAPRGTFNCTDLNICFREKHHIPYGTREELCGSVHAAQNAIINAARTDMLYSVLYIYAWDIGTNSIVKDPDMCLLCKRMVINAGIEEVVYADRDGLYYDPVRGYGYRIAKVEKWKTEYRDMLDRLLAVERRLRPIGGEELT